MIETVLKLCVLGALRGDKSLTPTPTQYLRPKIVSKELNKYRKKEIN